VERVCETVLILHQGKLLRQGTVSELCAHRQDRYRLQVQGDVKAFRDELLLDGVRIVEDNGRGKWRVAVPAGWVTRGFFERASNRGATLHGLQRDDESLEELFYRVLSEADETPACAAKCNGEAMHDGSN
jgi:ABC-type uncharacterized transport system ATPase subunit